ncbi:MAG TPA: hypothetical protein PKD79_02040 [Candidatus Doudnabacteria bacterium]|nr:hypothetical protein [Candidatus Doudnabacteria bacterium]
MKANELEIYDWFTIPAHPHCVFSRLPDDKFPERDHDTIVVQQVGPTLFSPISQLSADTEVSLYKLNFVRVM